MKADSLQSNRAICTKRAADFRPGVPKTPTAFGHPGAVIRTFGAKSEIQNGCTRILSGDIAIEILCTIFRCFTYLRGGNEAVSKLGKASRMSLFL